MSRPPREFRTGLAVFIPCFFLMRLVRSLRSLFSPSAWVWQLRFWRVRFRCFLNGGTWVWKDGQGRSFIARLNDPFSLMVCMAGGHEKKEMNWVCRWLGANETVLDCGANSGYFSFFVGQTRPSVAIWAIEGNRRTFQWLRKNVLLLQMSQVHPIQAILAGPGQSSLFIPDNRGREAWQRVDLHRKNVGDVLPVTISLDEFVSRWGCRPTFVKIDCEGFEMNVLNGAERLVKELRPAFMVECNQDALLANHCSPVELLQWFFDRGYKAFFLAGFEEHVPFGREISNVNMAREFNFAAIPNEPDALKKWKESIENHTGVFIR